MLLDLTFGSKQYRKWRNMGIQIRKIHKIAENKNPVSVAYYLQGNKKQEKKHWLKDKRENISV